MPRSITDKPPGPLTTKDDAFAGDVIRAKTALINTAEMRAALDSLSAGLVAAQRTTGRYVSYAGAMLAYYARVGELAKRTDGLFSSSDINAHVREWACDPAHPDEPGLRQRLDMGSGVAVGLAGGRDGRGRAQTPATVELAVRSVAYRVGGLSAGAADDRAAHEHNRGRPVRYWIDKERAAAYRKRVRDRVLAARGRRDSAPQIAGRKRVAAADSGPEGIRVNGEPWPVADARAVAGGSGRGV